jgi:hypothetical protein
MGGLPICHHSLSDTLCRSQPRGISQGQTRSPVTNNHIKDEYTNTQQDLPTLEINLPLDRLGFWIVGLFCQKTTKSGSLLLIF